MGILLIEKRHIALNNNSIMYVYLLFAHVLTTKSMSRVKNGHICLLCISCSETIAATWTNLGLFAWPKFCPDFICWRKGTNINGIPSSEYTRFDKIPDVIGKPNLVPRFWIGQPCRRSFPGQSSCYWEEYLL